MLDFMEETKATFVTNAVAHAQKLAAKGAHAVLIGGTLKNSTEAAVEQCMKAYVLCDNSKFNVVSAVTFSSLASGTILTDKKQEEFEEIATIVYA